MGRSGVSGMGNTSGTPTLGTVPLQPAARPCQLPEESGTRWGGAVPGEGQEVPVISPRPRAPAQRYGTAGLGAGCFMGFQRNKKDYTDFH